MWKRRGEARPGQTSAQAGIGFGQTVRRWFLRGLFAASTAAPAGAVIFLSTDDPGFNTTPPTGALADSGWQWVGQWGGFQGTAIGPHHFIALRHVGGNVGDPFLLAGVSYPTTAFFDDKESDLRVWKVSETFPSWAPLYRGDKEVRARIMVFGRGMIRGAEVRDAAINTLRGWQWQPGDGRLRWGQSRVVAVVDGGAAWGALLYATFDATGGKNEAHLALGDSSGPVFLRDAAGWKLAGVATTVDSAFNTADTGPGFSAAIFDCRGLYVGTVGHWKLISDREIVRSGFYATRISARARWIDTVVQQADGPVAAGEPRRP